VSYLVNLQGTLRKNMLLTLAQYQSQASFLTFA
jgi:hypothetical protein